MKIRGDGVGATRIAHAKAGGADQVERLWYFDSTSHVYRYSLEQTPMPVRNYTGEFRIDPAGDSASTVTWSAEFELAPEADPKTVDSIRQFLHVGVQNLGHQFDKRL